MAALFSIIPLLWSCDIGGSGHAELEITNDSGMMIRTLTVTVGGRSEYIQGFAPGKKQVIEFPVLRSGGYDIDVLFNSGRHWKDSIGYLDRGVTIRGMVSIGPKKALLEILSVTSTKAKLNQ